MTRPPRGLMIKDYLGVIASLLLQLTQSALALLEISNPPQNKNGNPFHPGVTFKLPAEHVDKMLQILTESYLTMQSEIANLRNELLSMTKQNYLCMEVWTEPPPLVLNMEARTRGVVQAWNHFRGLSFDLASSLRESLSHGSNQAIPPIHFNVLFATIDRLQQKIDEWRLLP